MSDCVLAVVHNVNVWAINQEVSTYSNRALGYPRNTIFPRGIQLSNSMPMDGSTIAILKLIDNCDLKPVAPISTDQRPWVGTVDQHGISTIPISTEFIPASDDNGNLQCMTC